MASPPIASAPIAAPSAAAAPPSAWAEFLARLRTAPASEQVRNVRIITGLVLLYYVFVHLCNHALGNISLDLMELVQPYSVGWFRTWPGTVLLGGAALTHFGLALWALYLKRRFRMPAWEAAQIMLGLLIPVLLVQHIVDARMAREFYGAESGYAYVIWGMRGDWWTYFQQCLLLIVAWTHGCMGLHYWLRFRSWYGRVVLPGGVVALTVPLLGLCGFLQAVREVERLAQLPRWQRAFEANAATVGDLGSIVLAELEIELLVVLGAVLALLMVARIVRTVAERRHGVIQVTFPAFVVTAVVPGPTVLEVSRSVGVAHASVCGGRCRCSTCRVRVGRGLEALPAPAANEARVLARIGAAHNVRLACQIRPTTDIEVTPLFPTPPDIENLRKEEPDYHQGREMEIAVMFADLRGFTAASEHQLPYDTVFLLNRYFREMGVAIQANRGVIDKFIGDGIMALFGLEDGLERGTMSALRAAREMSRRLDGLNAELEHDLTQPLRIGIGIHVGTAIVGDVGWGEARALTAIGDTVNTASRIEGLTKDFDCELLISADTARAVGAALDGLPRRDADVRGRSAKIEVIVVAKASQLELLDRVS
ncbi:MAG: adenylate/guanylate cyclase domain-containing protein [Rhodospirillaceae bacterium]|nr:adenylate/guanylate cyclase domain-containing protein [Rhodospirillaceae bacterium]